MQSFSAEQEQITAMHAEPLSPQEITRLRQETSGTFSKIHFNNAGSALPPDVVVGTVIDYLKDEALNGGYETEARYAPQLSAVYDSIAKLINADRDEVAIVENASTAWALAFHSIDFREGDEIITSEMEYVTNVIGFLDVKKKKGVLTRLIPNDANGDFDLEAFQAAINPRTRLIAITHIASTSGGMMPITAIGKVARERGILYLVDACQSAGQVPLDVQQIHCDMLSVTGRKYLRAPRGTGFLFVRKEIQDLLSPTMADGFTTEYVTADEYKIRGDARRFELYEKNRALTLGLGKAVDYALEIGVERIWERIRSLASLLRKKLKEIEGITVHDLGTQQCGIVTFSVDGTDPFTLKADLEANNINVSVGTARGKLVFMDRHGLASVVRASVHYYNTEEEIDSLVGKLSI